MIFEYDKITEERIMLENEIREKRMELVMGILNTAKTNLHNSKDGKVKIASKPEPIVVETKKLDIALANFIDAIKPA